MDISFLAAVEVDTRLTAEATADYLRGCIGLCCLAVTAEDGTLVALCYGTAYRKRQPLLE